MNSQYTFLFWGKVKHNERQKELRELNKDEI